MFVSVLALIFIGVLIIAVAADIVVTIFLAARLSRENHLLASAFLENETENNIGEQNREEDAG